MLGMALTAVGREDEALARLAAFTERESARIDAASIRGYFARAIVLWQSGRLARCEQTAADQLQLAATNDLPVSAGWGALFLGVVAHERGDLAQATPPRRHGDRGRRARPFHLRARRVLRADPGLRSAGAARAKPTGPSARLREIAIGSETASQLELVDSFLARTALIRGDLAAARRWLETSSPSARGRRLQGDRAARP